MALFEFETVVQQTLSEHLNTLSGLSKIKNNNRWIDWNNKETRGNDTSVKSYDNIDNIIIIW